METLLNFPPSYRPTKLKTLPLREQPAYRVASNVTGCNLAELLAAVVGGAQRIEVAEGLLVRFGGDIQRLYKANVAELAQVHGIGQQTVVRIKAALTRASASDGLCGQTMKGVCIEMTTSVYCRIISLFGYYTDRP